LPSLKIAAVASQTDYLCKADTFQTSRPYLRHKTQSNNMGNTFASAELPTGPVECSYTPPLKVNPSNPKVFFDMMIGSAQIGRIVMELKADVASSARIKSRMA
jgi:hypothetical protein